MANIVFLPSKQAPSRLAWWRLPIGRSAWRGGRCSRAPPPPHAPRPPFRSRRRSLLALRGGSSGAARRGGSGTARRRGRAPPPLWVSGPPSRSWRCRRPPRRRPGAPSARRIREGAAGAYSACAPRALEDGGGRARPPRTHCTAAEPRGEGRAAGTVPTPTPTPRVAGGLAPPKQERARTTLHPSRRSSRTPSASVGQVQRSAAAPRRPPRGRP